MPAAALRPLQLPFATGPFPAALAATSLRGRPPLHAVDDRTLIADLIGPAAAGLVASETVADLLDASPEHLARLGLPPPARRRLQAAAELARRYQPAVAPPAACRTPRDFLSHLTSLRTAAAEVLAVLPLDARLSVLGGLCLVAGGALMHVAVAAREVFAPAVERRAAAIVLAHNHPSGVPAPSREDVTFTREMERAGAVLGVRLVDHVVVARRGYFSFAEASLLGDDASPESLAALGP